MWSVDAYATPNLGPLGVRTEQRRFDRTAHGRGLSPRGGRRPRRGGGSWWRCPAGQPRARPIDYEAREPIGTNAKCGSYQLVSLGPSDLDTFEDYLYLGSMRWSEAVLFWKALPRRFHRVVA